VKHFPSAEQIESLRADGAMGSDPSARALSLGVGQRMRV
jgi:hypothetical protein